MEVLELEEKAYDDIASSYEYNSKQNIEVRENILTKLYRLQNYNVTMNMFKGSNLRWKSIMVYLNIIRRMTKDPNYRYNPNVRIGKNILKYIGGLVFSQDPLVKIDNNNKEITIDELITSGVLTNQEIEYIYSSVGPKNNEPDLSISGTRNRHNSHSSEREFENHATIVQEYSSNPIRGGNSILTTSTVPRRKTTFLPPWVKLYKLKYEK